MYDRSDLEKVFSWVGRLAIVLMIIIIAVVIGVAKAEPLPNQEERVEVWEDRFVAICMSVDTFKEAVKGYTMIFDGITDYEALNMLFVREDGSYLIFAVHVIQDANGQAHSGPPCLLTSGSRHELLGIRQEPDEEYEEAQ